MQEISILGFGEFNQKSKTNPQWMAIYLERNNFKVNYFNPPIYRSIQSKDLKRFFYRLISKKKNSNKNINVHNIFIYSKFYHTIKSLFFKKNFFKTLSNSHKIIIFQPLWYKIINKNLSKKIIYFKTDSYSALHSKKKILSIEKEIDSLKIPTIVTHHLLKKSENYFFYPNCIPDELVQKNYNNIKNKFELKNRYDAVYLGTISQDKINLELLLNLIKYNRVNLILIGKIDPSAYTFLKIIKNSSNIQYLGELDYFTALDLVSKYDFAIMPFKKNSYTKYMFPMKFFEYTYLRMPVLSTDLSFFDSGYLKKYKKYVYLDDNFKDIDIEKLMKSIIPRTIVNELISRFTYNYRIKEMIKNNLL